MQAHVTLGRSLLIRLRRNQPRGWEQFITRLNADGRKAMLKTISEDLQELAAIHGMVSTHVRADEKPNPERGPVRVSIAAREQAGVDRHDVCVTLNLDEGPGLEF